MVKVAGEERKNRKPDWYNSTAVKILTHVIIWVIALSIPYLLDSHRGIAHHQYNNGREEKIAWLNFLTNFLLIVPFYVNAYVLTPWLFFRRRYLWYITSLVLFFGIMLLVHYLLTVYVFALPHCNIKDPIRFLLPTFILIFAIGITFRMIKERLHADQLAQAQQQETLKTELSFLRSQISPHFIFNILNNLVALEQMKSPELGPTILKLSSLLQYMLYEAGEEKVLLSKEVEYIQCYIDLQRQRFGSKVPVTAILDAPPEGFYEIEPMLLIPFVENAFKHGVGMIEHPAIEISLQLIRGTLHFSVKNRYNPRSAEIKDKASGIGLGNVQRRLSLLYGNNHELHIDRNDGWFTVSLQLNLH